MWLHRVVSQSSHGRHGPSCGRAQRFTRSLRRFLREEDGGVLVLINVGLVAIVGFAALGVDLSQWYSERRLTQSIADSAAIGGTYASMAGGDSAAVAAAVLADAQRVGYVAQAGNTIAVDDPAPPPDNSLVVPRVEVTVARRVPLGLSAVVLGKDAITVRARAVGGFRGLGPLCVIALHETADDALAFAGGGTANIDCGVISNSSSDNALHIFGSAELLANPAQAYGDIAIDGSGELISELPPLPHSPRVNDPYADRVFPDAPPTCDDPDGVTVNPNTSAVLDAGGGSFVICGTLDVRGSLFLQPGTYYINNGDFLVSSQASVVGDGVTIVLTGDTPGDVGDIRVNGGATINLSAPDSGPFQGVVIYKDRDASPGGDNLFNGGADMDLLGIVYIPSQHVDWTGGSDSDGCTQIIASTVTFSGNSFIRNTPSLCENVGVVVAGGDSMQRQVVLIQ